MGWGKIKKRVYTGLLVLNTLQMQGNRVLLDSTLRQYIKWTNITKTAPQHTRPIISLIIFEFWLKSK